MWRALATLVVASALAAADLVHKTLAATPEWGYHVRSGAWLALTTGVVMGCVLLARVPSWAIAVAAGMVAGGAAGNALSAVASREGVPNPIVVSGPKHMIAFNLADVFTMAGILLLTSLLVLVTIDNRAGLVPPRVLLHRTWQRRKRR